MLRRKRQYCEAMMQSHCDIIFEPKRREADYNHSPTFVEVGRHFEEMCNEFHGVADYNTLRLQYADYFRTRLENRSPSSSLFTFPRSQSAMETSYFPSSDSMVNVTTSPIMLGSGSSRSGKRKFSFKDDTRSVRSCTSPGQTRFARRLGADLVDSLCPVLISAPIFRVCDWPHYSRYNDAMILPLRSDTLCPMQNEMSRQNSETSYTFPFVTWRSRQMRENECLPEPGGIMGLTNNSLRNQINGLSSATGFGIRTFQEESFMHPSFIRTSRDSYSESYVGTHARRYHFNDGTNEIETSAANGTVLYSFEPSSRFSFYRTRRHQPLNASRSSQSVHTEAFATSSRFTYEFEGALEGRNVPYVPVHGQGIFSVFSDYNGSGSPTPRSAPSRMPRRRRRQRFIRQQHSSHELLNQSVEYEETDSDSPQSDMDLDVDAMSYEELLVLGERIGNVETGLSEESIQKCLQTSKYSAPNGASTVACQKNEILCSICQEEFMENDELGLLVCGHSHHPSCIKQWLRLKNQCPICKSAAYSEC